MNLSSAVGFDERLAAWERVKRACRDDEQRESLRLAISMFDFARLAKEAFDGGRPREAYDFSWQYRAVALEFRRHFPQCGELDPAKRTDPNAKPKPELLEALQGFHDILASNGFAGIPPPYQSAAAMHKAIVWLMNHPSTGYLHV